MPLVAQTLSSITVLPPAAGYYLTDASATAQLSALCTYSDSSTDNCSTQSLTWGSSDPNDLTVSSTGLTQWGPGNGTSIASIVRNGSNNVTVTLTSPAVGLKFNRQIIIIGVTDTSFNGTFRINNNPNQQSATTFSFTQTGTAATSSGGSLYYGGAPDAYVYTGTILGHHPVQMSDHVTTSIAFRPEAATSTQIVAGTTVLASAADTTSGVTGTSIGDYCAWTSSAPSIAGVDSIGRVTGISVGSAVVTCSYYGLTATRTVNVVAPTLNNDTWYVRPDGGTRYDANVPTGQCDGKHDLPYGGTGVNQPCAFNHPMYLITDDTSTSVYTGAIQAGDTAIVYPASTPYLMGHKTPSVAWKYFGTIPSGTPAQHTKLLGSNHAACSSASAKTMLEGYYDFIIFDLRDTQNIDFSCMDISNFADCNDGLTTFSFPCPGGVKPFPFMADDFTASVRLEDMHLHGFFSGWTGTQGPDLVFRNVVTENNYLDGLNFDNPYGYGGNRAAGLDAVGLDASYNGCTEELPKTLTAVSRDGSGNLSVSFVANQMVNYVVGTNLVLSGMTPSDLNGTFPVSAITFSQQAVTITGGSCVSSGAAPYTCTFTTSSAPTFGTGEFVEIIGASPTWLNGHYEVYSSSGTGFVVVASPATRLGWTSGAISSGGTASTASSLVAAATGTPESASTVGTASHVLRGHRCFDQNDGGASNGDGVGTGSNTILAWTCAKCTFKGNLQDGWDMLHSAMTTSSFTNSFSSGNLGAPAKFGNADFGYFKSNILIANCSSLIAFDPNKPPDFNQYLSFLCRGNDGLPINARMWSHMEISNNTWDTTFQVFMDDGCSDLAGCSLLPAISTFAMQNNVLLGYLDTNDPVYNGNPPALYYTDSVDPPPWVWSNNITSGVSGTKTGPNNQWGVNPLVVAAIPNISSFAGETAALTYDMNLTAPSTAVSAGVHNAYTPTYDYAENPFSNPPSMGAYEFGIAPPTASTTLNGHVVFSGNVRF